MLMSLTMRLLPTPPEDSRGVTSVVAIPTPSFNERAKRPCPWFYGMQMKNVPLYGGMADLSRRMARQKRGGTCFETGKMFGNSRFSRYASVVKNCAMWRNLLYRDTSNSAGGVFFSSA